MTLHEIRSAVRRGVAEAAAEWTSPGIPESRRIAAHKRRWGAVPRRRRAGS